jgi:hypothetical protein
LQKTQCADYKFYFSGIICINHLIEASIRVSTVLFAYPIALSCLPLCKSHNENEEGDENSVIEWIELIDRILRQNIGKHPFHTQLRNPDRGAQSISPSSLVDSLTSFRGKIIVLIMSVHISFLAGSAKKEKQ